jgi:DUF1680 family protein
MKLTASHSAKFGLLLRIPAWAEGASVSINGKAVPGGVASGSFLRIQRKWKAGDRIALTLPLETRLEAINRRHPDTVALLRGPLVLFALGEDKPEIAQKQLLAARRIEKSQWVAEPAATAVKFVPFTEVGDAPYSTYLRLG